MTRTITGSVWTAELKSETADLWKTCSASQIAARLQAKGYPVTRNSVIGVLYRMGLTAASLPRIARARIEKAEQRETRKREYAAQAAARVRVRIRPDTVPVVLRCVDLEPRHLSLIDLEEGDCRYPYGDGEAAPYTFCAHPQMPKSSYCAHHHYLCWMPSIKPERIRKIAA